MKRVAIIGAGVAGLACARRLQAAGLEVLLLDKAAEPGGRCATVRTPAGPFDAGAAGFSAAGEAFAAQVQAWSDAGWLAADPAAPGTWIGTPGMGAWTQHLARGLRIEQGSEAAAIEPAAQGGWRLRLHAGASPAAAFEAVVVALPPEQAVPLLQADPGQAAVLRGVRTEPCWSVMVAWPTALGLRDEALATGGGPLASARREEAMRGRPRVPSMGTRWVLRAAPYWSANNLDVPPAQVVLHLLEAFGRAAGRRLARPAYAAAQLWRQAEVVQPSVEPCGWNTALRLGACGDAWHAAGNAGGIERAWFSGCALAERILQA